MTDAERKRTAGGVGVGGDDPPCHDVRTGLLPRYPHREFWAIHSHRSAVGPPAVGSDDADSTPDGRHGLVEEEAQGRGWRVQHDPRLAPGIVRRKARRRLRPANIRRISTEENGVCERRGGPARNQKHGGRHHAEQPAPGQVS